MGHAKTPPSILPFEDRKSVSVYYPQQFIEKILLKCIWRISDTEYFERKEIILPKGTCEIIFNFSDDIYYFCPTRNILKKLPVVFINGVNFRQFVLIKEGRQEFLGIQLNSCAFKFLFNIPAQKFNNHVYHGEDVHFDIIFLANKLMPEYNFAKQVEIILEWIYHKISLVHKSDSLDKAQKIQALIYRQNITVKNLSKEIGLSDRQLRRISNEWLGMSTEEFVQYNKYLASLRLLHYSHQSLTQIGLEAGYYDQSHFIREFKSYTGLTPSQYRKANKGIPGHIYL